MRESQFTAALNAQLKTSLYVQKFSVQFARGVPDCYYSGSQRDLWTEHKYFPTLPATIDLTKEAITSRLQQEWLIGRHKEGRFVGMIVGSGVRANEAHLFLPGLEWQKPLTRDEFLARAKNKKDLAKELIELLGPVPGPILP